MKNKLTLILTVFIFTFIQVFSQDDPFSMRVVNNGYQLNSAWELTYGPDDSLWVTENRAYKVSKISIEDGGKTEIIDLSGNKDFTNPSKWPQGGLMGMALHPSMYSEWPTPTKPWVYLAYVYEYLNCNGGPCMFKTKVVRYDYDRNSHSLSNEKVIISTLNGSNDHNSGRLAIGEVGGTPYLFYTIGDMGAGQFNNISRTNNAQSRNTLEGKILRFNVEPDGDSGDDAWIPNDNPFSKNGNKTPVWSWGHRNAQGIVMSNDGILYSSEQQDKSDDEVNIIEKGRNYGWPKVCGYNDGNYNGLKLANMNVGNENTNSNNLNSIEAAFTLFSEDNPENLDGNYLNWPTVAASSIDIYEKLVIPEWSKSLLVTSLKAGRVYRLKLNEAGTDIIDSATIPAMRHQGRYRDLCIAPDGIRIFVACDISGQTSGPTGGYNGGGAEPPHAGKILEFTYTGSVLSIDDTKNTYERNTKIDIFPNPASKILYVRSVKTVSSPLYYSIFDVTGKLLLKGKSNNDYFNINVESLTPGVYIFKLYDTYQTNISTKKVTIQ